MRGMHRWALGALFACIATIASAQGYPTRTIRLVVPFPAGGTTDILAREVAQKLTEVLGQAVVVDNRPGAAGNIGSDLVAKSAPDGYTLLMGTVGTHAINPSLYSKMPYDHVKDFAPVVLVAGVPNVLVVNPALPVNSVSDLIKLAKDKPGQINFASSGSGTSIHLSGELFKTMAGVDMTHVPYKGTSTIGRAQAATSAPTLSPRARPDGYTILEGALSTHAVNVSLYAKMPYDPVKDFAPITLVAVTPNVLVLNASFPVNSVPELLAYARANPGKLSFGSGSNGSAGHLAGELFKTEAGVDMVHIPYKGGAPALQALLSGVYTEPPERPTTLANSAAQLKAGRF